MNTIKYTQKTLRAVMFLLLLTAFVPCQNQRQGDFWRQRLGALNAFNLKNKLYFNHVSFIKEFTPEIGRGIRASYTVRFSK